MSTCDVSTTRSELRGARADTPAMILRRYTRHDLDLLGPCDLAPDSLGVVEVDLPDGRSFDLEVTPTGTRRRDAETGEVLDRPHD